ncbi:hypothetical protein PMAYCL1PPCAC_07821, partial [Pristionchus mayeri]
ESWRGATRERLLEGNRDTHLNRPIELTYSKRAVRRGIQTDRRYLPIGCFSISIVFVILTCVIRSSGRELRMSGDSTLRYQIIVRISPE